MLSWNMASRLAKAFGSTPEGWMRLQFQYDAAQVEERSRKIKVETFDDVVHAWRAAGRVSAKLSCSRNAHDKNVLVRRAQSRIDQATFETEIKNWEVARSGRAI